MIRTLISTVLGWLVGVGLTAGLLFLTRAVLRELTAPKVYEIDHTAVYLGLVLGGGFGCLCGALIGLSGSLTASRDRTLSP